MGKKLYNLVDSRVYPGVIHLGRKSSFYLHLCHSYTLIIVTNRYSCDNGVTVGGYSYNYSYQLF